MKIKSTNIYRSKLNREQRIISFYFFDSGQTGKNKWVPKASIPAIPIQGQYCKCEGQYWGPEELPPIHGDWGVCEKCSSNKVF